MGSRKIIVKQTAADNIAAISWYIESQGLIATGDKFADDVYDYFIKIADDRRSHPFCRHPEKALLRYKCLSYKKKYTIIFIELKSEIVICEFISSKLLRW